MKRITGRAVSALGLVAISAVLASCGSDSDAEETSAGSSSSDKSPLVLGSIVTQTGTFASSNSGGALGIKAWADAVNEQGGINGHPIELIVKDDQNNPSVGLSTIKEFAANDDMVAVVGSVSAVEEAWAPVASAAGLPVVGDFPYTSVSFSTKYVFPQGTTFPSVLYGQVYAAVKLAKAEEIAFFYCAEQPACSKSAPVIEAHAKTLGGSLVNAQGVPATAPNFDAQCSAAQKSGATAIVMALGTGTIISIAESCASIGYRPKYVFQTTALTPQQASVDPLADSSFGVVQTFPWVADSTPAQKAFQAAIKAADVPADKLGAAVSLGYTGGALFQEAAQSIEGEATRESVAEALWSLPPETTLDGLAPPLTYKRDAPSPEQKCFFVMQLSNGEWTSPYADEELCQP